MNPTIIKIFNLYSIFNLIVISFIFNEEIFWRLSARKFGDFDFEIVFDVLAG